MQESALFVVSATLLQSMKSCWIEVKLDIGFLGRLSQWAGLALSTQSNHKNLRPKNPQWVILLLCIIFLASRIIFLDLQHRIYGSYVTHNLIQAVAISNMYWNNWRNFLWLQIYKFFIKLNFAYRTSTYSFQGNNSFLKVENVDLFIQFLHFGNFMLHKLNSCRRHYW